MAGQSRPSSLLHGPQLRSSTSGAKRLEFRSYLRPKECPYASKAFVGFSLCCSEYDYSFSLRLDLSARASLMSPVRVKQYFQMLSSRHNSNQSINPHGGRVGRRARVGLMADGRLRGDPRIRRVVPGRKLVAWEYLRASGSGYQVVFQTSSQTCCGISVLLHVHFMRFRFSDVF